MSPLSPIQLLLAAVFLSGGMYFAGKAGGLRQCQAMVASQSDADFMRGELPRDFGNRRY